MAEIWRQRKAIADASPAAEAILLQFRFLRKIRQSRREADAAVAS